MVQRFVEVVLPLPLMARMIGGSSEVWMDIGVLRRTERGLEVEWTLPGRVFEPAWKSSSPYERATEARQWIEFAVRTDLGPRTVAWCAVTNELERRIREQVAALRGSKFYDATSRFVAPRWCCVGCWPRRAATPRRPPPAELVEVTPRK